MKRSKLFLGITSCMLAIAGVAAAKAHYFNSFKAAFHTSTPGACSEYNSGLAITSTNQNPNGTYHLLKTTGSSQKTLYSYNTAGAGSCAKPLYTKNNG